MEDGLSKLHTLLLRQLKRTDINEKDILPNKHDQWVDFLLHVSRTYFDHDQDRYLLERSMEISSREMMELNEKLEYAQQIAHLGYWLYDRVEDKLTWSKEMFRLAGIDPSEGEPKLAQAKELLIHENDRSKLTALIERAFSEGKDYEMELQFKNKKENEYYWLYVKGHPHIEYKNESGHSQSIRFLSGIAIDINKRKQAEQYEILQHALTSVLAENTSLITAAPELLRIICESFRLDIGELWVVDKITNVLRNVTVWFGNKIDMKEFVENSKQMTFLPGIGLPGRVWTEKKMCWIEDVVKDANFPRASFAKKTNLHSAFALPIIFEDEVLAVLEFISHRVFSINEEMMNLLKDVDRQIGIFIAREQSQRQVVTLSRQAGMSEVATSVLHNIGNILNSANVSISLVRDLITKSRTKKLISLSQIIKEHLTNKDEYLTNDQNGKLVPDYLVALSTAISEEFGNISNEINNIDVHLNHINDIVAMQNDISGLSGLKENLFLNEVVDLAIQMTCSSMEAKKIEIIKNYSFTESIITDKAKLLQILVNLFRNAYDAVLSLQKLRQKKLIVWIRKSESKPCVEIIIKDNGVGIASESLTRIFSFGFTTKPNGHGFGLHSSAITATELGGSLKAESEGVGEGATFTIELPLSDGFLDERKVDELETT